MTMPALTGARVRMRGAGVPGPRGGGVYVAELQRVRLLDATFAVVAEDGYRRMTARRVSGRAGVSNKTFYDLFEDREDCFLAAFDRAVEELTAVVVAAYEGKPEWVEGVRAGLGALLVFLEGEPALCRLVFVEALVGGSRVLERRAGVLGVLASVVDEGRVGMRADRMLAPLTAEGVVGGAFGVIHARLLEEHPGSLIGLLGALMAMIVLPYRGHGAAARELPRPVPESPTSSSSGVLGGLAARDFRPTQRTQRVLAAVAELCEGGFGPSNREVADAAGVADQGQISKLLARLEGVGLLQSAGGRVRGLPNAWSLTSRGEEVLFASRPTRGTSREASR